MRIAVCFSGGLRTFKLCKDNIINLFRRYGEVDFFIATWEKPCYTQISRYTDIHAISGSTVYSELLDSEDIITSEYLSSLCNFSATYIEPMETMHSLIEDCKDLPWHIMSPSRLLCQYYLMRCCNNIKNTYEFTTGKKYDMVVRLRPDIRLARVPDVLDVDKIYINSYVYTMEPVNLNHDGGINEMIYISNSDNMDNICRIYKNWNELWNPNDAYGERFSLRNFEYEGLVDKCESFDFGINVIRENGSIEKMGIS